MTKELIFMDTNVQGLYQRMSEFTSKTGRKILGVCREKPMARDGITYYKSVLRYEEENNEA